MSFAFSERIYEDHEFVVENIEDWLADSKNKLHFVRVMDKYCFIHSPQHYLLTEKSNFDLPPADAEWNYDAKQELLKVRFTKYLAMDLLKYSS